MRSIKAFYRRSFTCFTLMCLNIMTGIYPQNLQALLNSEFCTHTRDYQHPETPLLFSRTFFMESNSTDVERNAQIENTIYRHNYDIRLTHHDGIYSVFDQQGTRHDFIENNDGLYTPENAESGRLIKDDDGFVWQNTDADTHSFQGSYLTQVTNAAGESLTLNYENQRLQTITDDVGNSLIIEYDESRVSTLITPDGSSITLTNESCPQEGNAHSCDTDKNPYPPIDTSSLGSFVTGIDLRPQSCESYFVEYFGTERGSRIEDGLAQTEPYRSMEATVRSFPIVDFVDGDRFIAVRSRDLSNPSFNNDSNPNALLYRLNRDGQEIYSSFIQPLDENGSITTTENGHTTTIIDNGDERSVVLQLLIRDEMATTSHWQQIAQARENLAQRYQIVLEVVIIP